LGFRTFAIGRGKDKEALARKLGAVHYIDTAASDPAAELQKYGGANIILATAPDSKSMSAVFNGLSSRGQLLVVGATADPIAVTPLQLIMGSKALQGWASGTAMDSEDTLNFSALSGVRPMIEKYPLEKAAEAYQQMITGKARFRVVLTM
jgi:D-arabinose 1-dehydrogenase-like Zn-dependent alcohol dehydrogenase